jgi:hypothetical protein
VPGSEELLVCPMLLIDSLGIGSKIWDGVDSAIQDNDIRQTSRRKP